MQIKVALVGNPNSGKTTLFNAYTGAKHKVGNWAGVTVEKKEGTIKFEKDKLTLVDLPGIYSTSPYSIEEVLTREYILKNDIDVVVNIVDASNLERNLFLTLQLIELGKPIVIALNMIDIVENRGQKINTYRLSCELNIPVIPISAIKRIGLNRLLEVVINTAKSKKNYTPIRIYYGKKIENKISIITDSILDKYTFNDDIKRWISIKILEKDSEILKKYNLSNWTLKNYSEEIGKIKYDYITSFIDDIIQFNNYKENLSDKIDKILISNTFGIPLFLLTMILVFLFTFNVGTYLSNIFSGFLVDFSMFMQQFLESLEASEGQIALIVEGIIGGVGGILIFLPNIACLFFAISILEDSGYMARVALLMNKLMSRIGLNGKAFIPMILGFGCSIPAIMATRTLENEKDRFITIMIIPFMSCSAKMPIYVVLSGIFFQGNEVLIATSLYFLGVLIAVLMALIFNTTLKKEKTPLIMELPQYKLPSIKSSSIYAWEKIKQYIIKAGSIIFLASILLWIILRFNTSGYVDITKSIGADIGRFIAPAFKPLGFDAWEAALSLLAGIMGKEIVVSSMAVIFGVTEGGFGPALFALGFNSVSAYAFMAFCLLYTPCVATIGIIKKETGSWKWTFFSFIYQLLVAWYVGFIIYQIGSRIFI